MYEQTLIKKSSNVMNLLRLNILSEENHMIKMRQMVVWIVMISIIQMNNTIKI